MKELEQMVADEDGWSEWIHPLPGYLMGCCDCGLIHEVEFQIVPAHQNKTFNPGESEEHVIIFRAKRYEDA